MDLADLENVHRGLAAHVLGNGPSREEFSWPKDGSVVYACNAAYRDIPCHYLCALDFPMVGEIVQAKYPGRLVTRSHHITTVCERLGIEIPPHYVIAKTHPRVPCAGFFAVRTAMVMGCDPIYLHGFDGGDENLYAGSENYGETNGWQPPDWRGYRIGFGRVLAEFPDRSVVPHHGCYLADMCARSGQRAKQV